MSFTIEGLILKSLPYRERDHILTVFSKEQGLVSLFSKRIKPHGLNSPLTQAEFVIEQGKGELLPCREISLISSFYKIREKMESLESAFLLMRAILKSQFPQKPAPQLYELLIRYMNEIPNTRHPTTLSASFLLKVLRHEGLFGLLQCCSTCQTTLKTEFHIHQGESFCLEHVRYPYTLLSHEEYTLLFFLASCRNLNEISSISIFQTLHEKTWDIFSQAMCK